MFSDIYINTEDFQMIDSDEFFVDKHSTKASLEQHEQTEEENIPAPPINYSTNEEPIEQHIIDLEALEEQATIEQHDLIDLEALEEQATIELNEYNKKKSIEAPPKDSNSLLFKTPKQIAEGLEQLKKHMKEVEYEQENSSELHKDTLNPPALSPFCNIPEEAMKYIRIELEEKKNNEHSSKPYFIPSPSKMYRDNGNMSMSVLLGEPYDVWEPPRMKEVINLFPINNENELAIYMEEMGRSGNIFPSNVQTSCDICMGIDNEWSDPLEKELILKNIPTDMLKMCDKCAGVKPHKNPFVTYTPLRDIVKEETKERFNNLLSPDEKKKRKETKSVAETIKERIREKMRSAKKIDTKKECEEMRPAERIDTNIREWKGVPAKKINTKKECEEMRPAERIDTDIREWKDMRPAEEAKTKQEWNNLPCTSPFYKPKDKCHKISLDLMGEILCTEFKIKGTIEYLTR